MVAVADKQGSQYVALRRGWVEIKQEGKLKQLFSTLQTELAPGSAWMTTWKLDTAHCTQ